VAGKILEHGWKRVLVLEDDCTLEPFSPKLVTRINRFLRNRDPEIFYLGVLLHQCWLTWNIGIARCRGLGAHAYMISDQGCRKILAWEDYAVGKAIDNLFYERFKGYCAFPMIAFQNEVFPSDIEAERIGRTERGKNIDRSGSLKRAGESKDDLMKKQYSSARKYWRRTLLRK
jgi:glycosyl transferase family 25